MSEPIPSQPPPLSTRPRTRLLHIVSATLLVIAGAIAGFFYAVNTPWVQCARFAPRRPATLPTVLLLVVNRTPLDLQHVTINGEQFGDIPAGGATGPKLMDGIYRYAAVSAGSPAGPLAIQPIDYTGERLLPAGMYTYALTLHHGRLDIECIVNM